MRPDFSSISAKSIFWCQASRLVEHSNCKFCWTRSVHKNILSSKVLKPQNCVYLWSSRNIQSSSYYEQSAHGTRQHKYDIRGRIIGCQVQMNTFYFFFGLNLGQRLFSHTDNLSRTLQQTKMSAISGKQVALSYKRRSAEDAERYELQIILWCSFAEK